MGQMGQFLDGSYGSWVDALSPMTHLHIYRKQGNFRCWRQLGRPSLVANLPCHAATDVFDPLYWWEQHEQSYPILSDCARRLLVIQAYSAECERHFSAFNARLAAKPALSLKLWRLCQLC